MTRSSGSGAPRSSLNGMRFFIDTGSVAEVEEIAAWGVLSGATTNPSLLAKEEGDPGDAIKPHLRARRRPGVRRGRLARRRRDGRRGPRAARRCTSTSSSRCRSPPRAWRPRARCTDEGIRVNMTLVFSANQALLTAEAGATYISCFMGRLDDISIDSADGGARDRRDAAAGRLHGPGAGRLDPPSRARRHGRPARLRGRDRARQGAPADARPPADHGGHRASSRPTGSRAPSSREWLHGPGAGQPASA